MVQPVLSEFALQAMKLLERESTEDLPASSRTELLPVGDELYLSERHWLSLERISKLRSEPPVADERTRQQHQRAMRRCRLLEADAEPAKLVQPGQAPLDRPACRAQTAAVGHLPLGNHRLDLLFSALRCGSES